MRITTALAVIALLGSGCQKGTFVALSITQADATRATARIDLSLVLNGATAKTTLGGTGVALTFPTTATLQIGSGSGPMSVTATAYDSAGLVIDGASTTVDVLHDATVALALALGGPVPDMAMNMDLGGGDIALVGDMATVDMTPVLTAPSPPQDVVASGGNAQASVSWTAPANMGNSPITSYTVTPSPAGSPITTSGTTTMATFTGLTNDTTYTFTVVATNAIGSSAPASSNQVTPTATPMAPSAPTNVSAIANIDHGATVNWSAADNHGSLVTSYTITATGSAGIMVNAGPTATSRVVTGLTSGTLYTFIVTATNSVGTSSPSVSSNPITAATAPDSAPTSVTAMANLPSGATVSWTPPVSDGYSTLTSYTVIATPGGATASTADGKTTSLAMMGLTAGTAYTFTVTASNILGTGPASSPSSPVTIIAKAPSPTVNVCASNGQIWVSHGSVSGATSYNIYYSTSSPASGGTKLANASNPQSITVANGAYYVSVSAVTVVGEGALSADQQVSPGSAMHDTLFVAEPSTPAIDVYDCFSVAQTSTPTRSITATLATNGFSPLAVDGPGSVLFASDGTNIQIWTNAQAISGDVAPNYTLSVASEELSEVAVDVSHHKLYAYGSGSLYRFSYTSAASLNGTPTPEASLQVANSEAYQYGATALSTDTATGDLWWANSATNAGASESATAYQTLTQSTSLQPNPSWNITIYGVAFDSSSGSVFISDASEIAWYDSATISSGSAYLRPDGQLAVGANALASGNGLLFALVAAQNNTVEVWKTTTVSGSPTRTLTSTHTHGAGNGGLFYVP